MHVARQKSRKSAIAQVNATRHERTSLDTGICPAMPLSAPSPLVLLLPSFLRPLPVLSKNTCSPIPLHPPSVYFTQLTEPHFFLFFFFLNNPPPPNFSLFPLHAPFPI